MVVFFGGHAGNFEYAWNRCTRVGMKGFSDYGSINICCSNKGESRIHHNFINEVGDPTKENVGIYVDSHSTNCHVNKNVLINIGPKNGVFGNYWMAFVASKGNSAYDNWIHGNRSVQDMFLPHLIRPLEYIGLRHFFVGRRNKLKKNTYFDELPAKFPDEAQEVIELAGLEKASFKIKDYLKIDPVL